MSKNLRIQGYNSKIVSADKAEREQDLKLDQSYVGFRPTVDTALIPLCNTRFIKVHKPSNHICTRIKSHIYTTEWIVYHITYHVKRYNKTNTNVIYYINDKKCLIQRKRSTNTIKALRSWSRVPQGRRLGDEHLEVLVVLVALDELPRVGRNWAAVA